MTAALGVLGIVVFVLVLLTGLLLTIVGLPGNWLILLAGVVYSWATGWARIPLWLLGVLLAATLVAEIADNLLGAAGVKRYGGSTKGMAWSVVGGLLGAFALGAALSAPLGLVGSILGPIIGGLGGGFAGGYWYEKSQGKSPEEARRAGMGALLGRTAGMILKGVTAAIMVVVLLLNAF